MFQNTAQCYCRKVLSVPCKQESLCFRDCLPLAEPQQQLLARVERLFKLRTTTLAITKCNSAFHFMRIMSVNWFLWNTTSITPVQLSLVAMNGIFGWTCSALQNLPMFLTLGDGLFPAWTALNEQKFIKWTKAQFAQSSILLCACVHPGCSRWEVIQLDLICNEKEVNWLEILSYYRLILDSWRVTEVLWCMVDLILQKSIRHWEFQASKTYNSTMKS